VVEAVEQLNGRLDELKALEWYDFSNQLWPILEGIFINLEIDTLPFTAFSSWYPEQSRTVDRLGQGSLRWPGTFPERLSVQMRLVFHLMGSDGARRGFRMAFVRGGAVHGEDVPAYVHLVLRPFAQTFGKFLECNETTTDPYVAERWSALPVDEPVSMTEDELEMLRTRRGEYRHFIDCASEPAEAWVGEGDKQIVNELTAGEEAVFFAAFAASREGDGYFDPSELDVESNSPPALKKRFQRVRRKVEGDSRLFLSRERKGSRAYDYRFEPGDDVAWVVILPS